MRSDELDYDLPPELIAQHPTERRDASRLLVYERATGAVRHRTVADLPDELDGELVVVNDTKVVPARLRAKRATGGDAEVLLLEPLGAGVWEALARPSRRLRVGERLGPVSCSSRSARGGGVFTSTVSPPASRRCRRTSTSDSPTRAATRPCMPPTPARQPRRPRASTSLPSCWHGSTSSA